jgi:hypothetical protein
MELTIKEAGSRSPIVEVVACDKCQNTWLEQIRVNRYLARETTIGTPVATTIADSDLIVLRCIMCGHLMVPVMDSYGGQGALFARLAEMADAIEENQNGPDRDTSTSKDS